MTAGEGGVDDLLAQMQELQQRLADAEAAAGAGGVEGTAGGGAVRIRAAGEFSFTAVEIDPSVVDPGDVQLLEDLVLAAVRDATSKLTDVRRKAMGTAVSSALEGLLGGIGTTRTSDAPRWGGASESADHAAPGALRGDEADDDPEYD
ncbi:MAG TPA: YbaB/EbfC family nucleoid-associated protein [Acidimicrobiales bacterium]|nr:YbaB/EbfC family nucleoid-associated protein [Acidimicrobiales bacterium]